MYNSFNPPDKHCDAIKNRQATFMDWKENAALEKQV
jgi:hypothetical protein